MSSKTLEEGTKLGNIQLNTSNGPTSFKEVFDVNNGNPNAIIMYISTHGVRELTAQLVPQKGAGSQRAMAGDKAQSIVFTIIALNVTGKDKRRVYITLQLKDTYYSGTLNPTGADGGSFYVKEVRPVHHASPLGPFDKAERARLEHQAVQDGHF